jgi:hypothetical protein
MSRILCRGFRYVVGLTKKLLTNQHLKGAKFGPTSWGKAPNGWREDRGSEGLN